ncbi:hypothetical protein AWM75_03405 [Aerococcus urinaehominis]|uniref:Uncharacterized protein n=1 Tax=Aerococcus urinaehominis TaxID=128944 RepID=A0A0X8FKQ8_9LACT|nr:amidohydrolase [Aerococcus urinaehominis]AMB99105.1 hypothetical protein AWM75_03405 [Aerococcus urinaehominis]SDM03856.1 amidohydrolase [Aerococcus urinaehominis]
MFNFTTIKANFNQYLQIRHDLHQHPEASLHEDWTVAYLKKCLAKYDLEIRDVPASKSFIAILDTGRPGLTLGLRTDMDALPIQEAQKNLVQAKKVHSQVANLMHACGHDAHMAILMGTIDQINGCRDQLCGRFIFIFESGEEVAGSVGQVVDFLADYQLDYIYGNHVYNELEVGKLALDAGPVMAGGSSFGLVFHGKPGHGSRPDLAINPLFCGIDFLNSLAVAWANQLPVDQIATLGITQFHAGSANNVFPDQAYIGGSIRFFDKEVGQAAFALVDKLAQHAAAMHQCQYEKTGDGAWSNPVINDANLANQVGQKLEAIKPGLIQQDVVWYASESFADYQALAPTLFTFVGIKNDGLGSGAAHHTPEFDLDDEALVYGIAGMLAFASLNWLKD